MLHEDALALLRLPLDPDRVTVGDNGPLKGIPYLQGHDVIENANRIFGEGGWGFRVAGIPTCIESGEQGQKGTTYGVYAVMGTLSVAGGLEFSDIGTSVRQGSGSGGLEMAVKGAATDALKRCLRMYGDQFGLVLYDGAMGMADLRREFAEAGNGERVDTATGEITPAAPAPVEPSEDAKGLRKWLHESGWKIGDEHVRMVLQITEVTPQSVNDALERWYLAHPGPRPQQQAALGKQISDMHVKLVANDAARRQTAGVN